MPSITSACTIDKLRIVFSTHGLPWKVVTDNRPSFTSEEFRTFLSNNGITHVTTAPYHPSSNGLAERAVQTFKQGVKRTPGATLQERISKFLFHYRITPQTTTGVPPATLLLGCCPRSHLDTLFPDLGDCVEGRQAKQAQQHDSTKPLRSFEVGDLVYAKDFATTPVYWVPGKVAIVTGPLSYLVLLMTVIQFVDTSMLFVIVKFCTPSRNPLNHQSPMTMMIFPYPTLHLLLVLFWLRLVCSLLRFVNRPDNTHLPIDSADGPVWVVVLRGESVVDWWTGYLSFSIYSFPVCQCIHFLCANVCVYHIRQFGPSLVRACPLSVATACTRVTTVIVPHITDFIKLYLDDVHDSKADTIPAHKHC